MKIKTTKSEYFVLTIAGIELSFVKLPSIPFRKTLIDFKSWDKWVLNGWIQRHAPGALVITFLFNIINTTIPRWEYIILQCVLGFMLSYLVEFVQKWIITSRNPNKKWTKNELQESSKDWIATTLFFWFFILAFNLGYIFNVIRNFLN